MKIPKPNRKNRFYRQSLNYTQYFICSFKLPDERNDDFIRYLDFFIYSMNLDSFANFVISRTRTVLSKTHFLSTVIDVILYNNGSSKKKSLINFPFSDHDIVTCEFNFHTSKYIPSSSSSSTNIL